MSTQPLFHLPLALIFIFFAQIFVVGINLASTDERPNIVLILADDLGYSDLGCYGGEIQTPHLDALAAGGLRFKQFYNTTRCCPSRASINTGLYPHQAGIGSMSGNTRRRGYEGHLTDRCVTLAEVLKSAGYRTYMSGKWHMHEKPTPVDRGFDEFFGLLGGFTSYYKPEVHTRLPQGRPLRTYEKDKYYATDVFTDYALDFIADARKKNENGERKPFFLYYAHTAPHFPLHAPKEDIAKYANVYEKGWDKIREERFDRQRKRGVVDDKVQLTPRSEIPRNWANAQTGWADKDNPAWTSIDADRRADLARRMAIFAAMVDRMDQNIGRVVDDLKRHGELDNTLIIFLSDNGACAEWDPWGFDISSGPKNILHTDEKLEQMGSPGTYHSTGSGWANVSNTPWRLYKHYIHEGGIRTPMIAHWPKGIKRKGEFESSVGHIIDFMPTFVELAGAKYPDEFNGKPILPMEGRSLLNAFEGKQTESRTLYWEHEGNRGVREGDMKLVWIGVRNKWELYDLKSDPSELNDLAAKRPETVEKMSRDWQVWARRALVITLEPTVSEDKTPGLKFELDFTKKDNEIRDISGKSNPVEVYGKLPFKNSGREFNRNGYIEVPKSDSLVFAKTAFAVEATFVPANHPEAKDGVLLANGGSVNGFSMALRNGVPVFAVTTDGKRHTLQGTDVVAGKTTLRGTVDENRHAVLSVDGVKVVEQEISALLQLPNETMQIGLDRESQVNDPRLPGFQGEIERVRIWRGLPQN